MASEYEFPEVSSLIESLVSSRNRDLALFLPFILALRNNPITAMRNLFQNSSTPDEGTEENPTSTSELPDRIILINPFTQGMVVIDGDSSSSLDFLLRDLLNKDGQPPASKASIGAMPLVEINTDGEECVICLEEWETGGLAKEMPCKHRFHGECIEKWLKIHGSCPVCRYKMPVEENDDHNKKADENSGRRRELWVSFSYADSSDRRSEDGNPTESSESADSSSSPSSIVDQNLEGDNLH